MDTTHVEGKLSSVLFLIIISDLNKAWKFTQGLLYADNTTIIVTGQNLRHMNIKISKDLKTWSQ